MIFYLVNLITNLTNIYIIHEIKEWHVQVVEVPYSYFQVRKYWYKFDTFQNKGPNQSLQQYNKHHWCLYIPSGAAHMDLTKACKALLDGMSSAIMDLKPSCLKLIRIVIFQQSVFQAFRSDINLTHTMEGKACVVAWVALFDLSESLVSKLLSFVFFQIRAGEPLWTNSHSPPKPKRCVFIYKWGKCDTSCRTGVTNNYLNSPKFIANDHNL